MKWKKYPEMPDVGQPILVACNDDEETTDHVFFVSGIFIFNGEDTVLEDGVGCVIDLSRSQYCWIYEADLLMGLEWVK